MIRSITLFLVAMLVHLQVAGASCGCIADAARVPASTPAAHAHAHAHDHLGHSHRHAHGTPPARDASPQESGAPDHRDGVPCECNCEPTPPLASPETRSVLPDARGQAWLPEIRSLNARAPSLAAPRTGVAPRPRPPDSGEGVTSSSPWALPVLQV